MKYCNLEGVAHKINAFCFDIIRRIIPSNDLRYYIKEVLK